MRRLLLYLLTLSNILFAVNYDYPSLWEKRELPLIEKQDLKSILDAGIRPYRFPSMERTSMSFKHLNVSVILPDGRKTPYFPIDISNMSLCEPGFLETMKFRSRRMTTEEGKTEMLKWVHLSDKTEQDVIDYCEQLETFAKSQNFKKPPGFSFGRLFKGDSYGVGCYVSPTGGYYDTMRLSMGFSWKPFKTNIEYNSFEGPIPPPEGYENISLEAPKKFGPDSLADVLEYKQEYAKLKGLPIPQEYEMPPIPHIKPKVSPTAKVEEHERSKKTLPKTKKEKPSRLWWIIGIVALLAIVFWILKGKKSA